MGVGDPTKARGGGRLQHPSRTYVHLYFVADHVICRVVVLNLLLNDPTTLFKEAERGGEERSRIISDDHHMARNAPWHPNLHEADVVHSTCYTCNLLP